MAKDGFLGEEVDEFCRWFKGVYPQHKLTVHYKWKKPEHIYYFEVKRAEGNTQVMPLMIPDAWFEDPEMEKTLHENFLSRMQRKTIAELG